MATECFQNLKSKIMLMSTERTLVTIKSSFWERIFCLLGPHCYVCKETRLRIHLLEFEKALSQWLHFCVDEFIYSKHSK